MSACRSCGAPIRWAETAAGKPMPLDAVEDLERGNVRLLGDKAEVLAPEVARSLRANGATLYLPHHASCPQAEDWRR